MQKIFRLSLLCLQAAIKHLLAGPSYERHLKKHFKNSENCVKEIKQKQIQQDNAKEKPKLQSASYELNICHESKQSVPITSNFDKSEVRTVISKTYSMALTQSTSC